MSHTKSGHPENSQFATRTSTPYSRENKSAIRRLIKTGFIIFHFEKQGELNGLKLYCIVYLLSSDGHMDRVIFYNNVWNQILRIGN